MATASSASLDKNDVQAKIRPLANFPKDMWGDRFDNFTTEDRLRMEKYAKEVVPLKEDVKIMLMDKNSSDLAKITLIDLVERLGFSYYYDTEINELLLRIFKELEESNFIIDHDLCNIALQFRMFRQHGYRMPCDVFNKFTNAEGNFIETLKRDVRGMLSLYEAAHTRVHGEDILDRALIFTTDFLKSIAAFNEQARLALINPLTRGCERVQAQQFISLYEKDDSHDEKLLRLAKIEFNRLQLLHCQELSQFRKWWKSFDFERKLPYVRQRSVEAHFAGIIMFYEPQYSWARVLVSKIYMYETAIDDTYDAYGTFDELQILTDAFERWDLSSMEQFQEDYMKVIYEFTINVYDEFAEEMIKRGRPYAAPFFKKQVLKLIRNYLIEREWVELKYTPTFEEYMETTRITCGAQVSTTGAMVGLEEVVGEKQYAQIMQQPKAVKACEDIIRLKDDIVTSKAELARGCRLVSSVECYMKDYDKNEEEVLQIFKQKIEDAWKNFTEATLFINTNNNSNGECVHFSKPVFDRMQNYARVMEFMFQFNDGYSFPDDAIKDSIINTYHQPFSI